MLFSSSEHISSDSVPLLLDESRLLRILLLKLYRGESSQLLPPFARAATSAGVTPTALVVVVVLVPLVELEIKVRVLFFTH